MFKSLTYICVCRNPCIYFVVFLISYTFIINLINGAFNEKEYEIHPNISINKDYSHDLNKYFNYSCQDHCHLKIDSSSDYVFNNSICHLHYDYELKETIKNFAENIKYLVSNINKKHSEILEYLKNYLSNNGGNIMLFDNSTQISDLYVDAHLNNSNGSECDSGIIDFNDTKFQIEYENAKLKYGFNILDLYFNKTLNECKSLDKYFLNSKVETSDNENSDIIRNINENRLNTSIVSNFHSACKTRLGKLVDTQKVQIETPNRVKHELDTVLDNIGSNYFIGYDIFSENNNETSKKDELLWNLEIKHHFFVKNLNETKMTIFQILSELYKLEHKVLEINRKLYDNSIIIMSLFSVIKNYNLRNDSNKQILGLQRNTDFDELDIMEYELKKLGGGGG